MGDLVGVKVGDDGAVGVVHGVVPAVVRRHIGPVLVARRVVRDFFSVESGEKAEGETVVGLAEEGFEQVADEGGAVAVEDDFFVLFGLAMLVGEPGSDFVAGNVVFGFRWLAGLWRGRQGDGETGR